EVNYDPLDHTNDFDLVSDIPQLALATCNNSGNELLTVYYAGVNTAEITMSLICLTQYDYKPGRPAGINKVDKNGYALYPNPVSNVLNITQADDAAYTVTDAVGRTLDAGTLQGDKAQVNTTRLTPGMYILHISKNGHAEKVKFV